MSDRELDLVYIATPPSSHAELATAAVRSGKPALVEKPFAMDALQARVVDDLAERAGVPVFEGMHSLHHRLMGRVIEILQEPRIGRLEEIDARFQTPIARRSGEFRWVRDLGGGALLDLGVYPLAWCRFFAGEPLRVTGARAAWCGEVEEAVAATLEFASGVRGRIECSMAAPVFDARLELRCTHATIRVDNPLCPQHGHCIRISADGGTDEGEIVDGPTTFMAQLAAVRDALVGRAAFPLPKGDYVVSMIAIDMVRAKLHR